MKNWITCTFGRVLGYEKNNWGSQYLDILGIGGISISISEWSMVMAVATQKFDYLLNCAPYFEIVVYILRFFMNMDQIYILLLLARLG